MYVPLLGTYRLDTKLLLKADWQVIQITVV